MARETGVYRRGDSRSGGLQQRYRTASAYAKALGLKTEAKPKLSSPS
jgi:hypothetical protein